MEKSSLLCRGMLVAVTATALTLAPQVVFARGADGSGATVVAAGDSDAENSTQNVNCYLEAGKDCTYAVDWEWKESGSSSYLRADKMSGYKARIYVDGAYDKVGSGTCNCTDGGFVRVPHLGEFEIHNTVYEHDYACARLTCWADAGYSYLSGVWSPDCAGNYPDLNY